MTIGVPVGVMLGSEGIGDGVAGANMGKLQASNKVPKTTKTTNRRVRILLSFNGAYRIVLPL
jgi:hypothetical protein